MSTMRDLLQVIIEEEIKHQQALAALRDLQEKYNTLKAEHDKCLARRKKNADPKP